MRLCRPVRAVAEAMVPIDSRPLSTPRAPNQLAMGSRLLQQRRSRSLVTSLFLLHLLANLWRSSPTFTWGLRMRGRASTLHQPVVIRCAGEVDPGDCKGVREDSIKGVKLPPLQDDDPAWLSFMIARYLDDEWLEQEVHNQIGTTVAALYKESRLAGDDELALVLPKLCYGLKDIWKSSGFNEAFEGPFDIANRAAEFLMLRQGLKVFSYGRSNDEVQKKVLARMADYEALLKNTST